MQKQFLAFIFLLATASAFAQPLYVQSNIGANTDPIPLTRESGYASQTILATQSYAAGNGTWQWFGKTYNRFTTQPEAARDTAIWRCAKQNQSISAFNTVISPVMWQPSAIRHNNRGGFVGKLPAVTAGKYYTFTIRTNYPTPLVGYKMAVLETDYQPVKLDTAVTLKNGCMLGTVADPQSQYLANDTVSVKASYSNGTLHTGETLYIAYSNDGFAHTSLEEMTPTTAGLAKYVFPANTFTPGKIALYYIFTSNKSIGFLRNNIPDIDLYSLSTSKNTNVGTLGNPAFVASYHKISFSATVYRFSVRTGWKSRNPFCLAYNRFDTLRLYPTSVSSSLCDASSGGTVSYSWKNPAGALEDFRSVDTAMFANITTASAGIYFVTATCSSTGCSATASINLTTFPELNPGATQLVPQSSCSNGTAVLQSTPFGGLGPYTFLWRWGVTIEGTTANIAATSGTVHTVYVTDANGCSASGYAIASENVNLSEPEVDKNISKNPTCVGTDNGIVGVSMKPCKGTGCLYSYQWSAPSIGNAPVSLNNMPAGTYTVTITNTYNGTSTCRNITTITIYEPNPLMITFKTAPNCYRLGTAANGQIKAFTTGGYNPKYPPGYGGIPGNKPDWPYYRWSNGVRGAEDTVTLPQTIKRLANGCYTVTVTDINGCTASNSICLDSVFTLQTTALAPVTCFAGRTGQAAVTAIPIKTAAISYSYAWGVLNIGNPLDTARYLGAGTQTVTVTAASGCKASASVVIGDNTASLTFNLTRSPNSYACAGLLNGVLAVRNPQGDPDTLNVYSYSWQQIGATGTTSLLAKNDTLTTIRGNFTYQVTVTSIHGCTATASTMITQATTTVSPESSTLNIKCKGETNGAMTVTLPSGTISDYDFSWRKDGIATSSLTGNAQTGLTAGVYAVEVTDNITGCKGYADGLIEEPASLLTATVVAGSVQGTTCYGGNDGTVTILAQGGAPGLPPAPEYTYAWSPQGVPSLANPTTLEALTYSVRVTDGNGCSKTITNIAIPGPTQPISFTIATRNKACGIEPTGKVCVTNVQNATPPYTYLWNTPTPQTDSCATMLLSGNYVVTVTDTKGCTASANTTIPSVAVDLIVRDTSINCGQKTVVPSVMTNTADPYYVLWSPAAGISNVEDLNPTITPTATANYTISISKNGCTLAKNVKITVNYCDGYAIPTAFMPNGTQAENHYFKPLGNGFTLKTFRIFNRWGQVMYDGTTGNGWDGTFNGEPQASGTYVYLIEYIQNNETKQDSGEVTLLR